MRLYNSSVAPNPRRVRIFLAEKGVSVPLVEVNLAKFEHKTPAFSAVNPFHTIPALELDDGTVICESIAICRYIEEVHPDPNLFGATALERATIDMWLRLAEGRLLLPIAQVFRHTHPHMALLENPQVADWAAANRPRAVESMATFDKVVRDRRFLRETDSPSPTSPGLLRSTSRDKHGSMFRPNSPTSIGGAWLSRRGRALRPDRTPDAACKQFRP